MADVEAAHQKRLLDKMQAGLLADWENLRQSNEQVPPWIRTRLRKWANGDLQRNWTRARTVAVEAARQMTDFALLDYDKRRRADTWLGLVTPYSYWQTRSARNWAIRMAQQPGTLAHYLKYQDAMRTLNEQRGYRSRFEGSAEIPTGDVLPEWMGESVFVNPTSIFFPFAQLEPNDWDNPLEARNGVDFLYRTMGHYGFKPYGFLDVSLQAAGMVGEQGAPGEQQGMAETIMRGLPQVRAVESAKSLMQHQGPAGAIFGGGAPVLSAWDTYRVGRMLSNMASEAPGQTNQVLLAQAIMQQVGAGQLRPGEALGLEPSGNLSRMMEQQGISEEELVQAQGILGTAWQRAQQESAVAGLSGTIAGIPLRVYPAGERQQVNMQRQMYAQQYSPLTQTGSHADYEAYRVAHPETYTRSVTNAAAMGGLNEEWGPARARGVVAYRQEKSNAMDTLQRAQLEALQADGLWNRDRLGSLRDSYTEQITSARERLLGPSDESYTWAPKAGSSPTEVAEQARDAVLGVASSAMPKRADYETSESYELAKTQFFNNITRRLEETDQQALPPNWKDIARDIDEDALRIYWRENDTLPEALQAAFNVWYGEQWDAYHAAAPEIVEGLSDEERDARYEQRAQAWDQYIANGPEITQDDLISRVKQLYGEKWNGHDIHNALQKAKMPTLFDAWFGNKTPEEQEEYKQEQALRSARDEFWDSLDALPKGADWKSTRGQPLVAMILDKDSRGTATAEQYEMAAAVLKQYIADHGAGSYSGNSSSYSGKKQYYYRRYSGGGGGGGSGGGLPRPLSNWNTAKRYISGALSRQLSDYYLRGTQLDSGAQAELLALAERLGWHGDINALLEALRGAFKSRTTSGRAPKRWYKSKK